MRLANQKELDEASYNDYQIATERLRRKRDKLIADGLIADTIDVVLSRRYVPFINGET